MAGMDEIVRRFHARFGSGHSVKLSCIFVNTQVHPQGTVP